MVTRELRYDFLTENKSQTSGANVGLITAGLKDMLLGRGHAVAYRQKLRFREALAELQENHGYEVMWVDHQHTWFKVGKTLLADKTFDFESAALMVASSAPVIVLSVMPGMGAEVAAKVFLKQIAPEVEGRVRNFIHDFAWAVDGGISRSETSAFEVVREVQFRTSQLRQFQAE